MAPNDSLNNLGNGLKTGDICIAEIFKTVTVNVDDAGNPAVSVEKGHNYLGSGSGTAGDVAWKLFDIRNYNGLTRRVGVSANALVEIDPRAR